MAASTKGGVGQDVDLDLFLTAIESKLRGPFSSLDLTKTVTTAALRGNDVSEVQYLKQIAQVLNKSEKIIQMRVLIGLLGLDPEPEINEVIFSLVRQAQGKGEDTMDREDLTEEEKLAQRYEEWVRVVAGLIQGVMFKKDEEEDAKNYGEEAQGLIDSTCDEVLQKIEKLAQEVEKQIENEKDDDETTPSEIDTSLKAADVDPMMAPYRFSLLNPNMLKDALPEALDHNPHFAFHHDVEILNIDARQEETKAQEEADYALQKQQVVQKTGAPSSQKTTAPAKRAVMPGERSGNSSAAKKKAAVRPKSSLFITRKPAAVSAAAKRSGLHVRKKGAAMGLVGKGRQLQGTGGVNSGVGGGAMRLGAGRAQRVSAHSGGAPRSKMKMIDASEAVDLAKQQQETPAGKDRSKKLLSLKRKAPGEAGQLAANKAARTENGAAVPTKQNAPSRASKPAAAPAQKEGSEPSGESANALAAAALTKYQTQMAVDSTERNKDDSKEDSAASALAAAALTKYRSQTTNNDAAPNQAPQQRRPSQPRQLNWQQLLEDKSNKLTTTDRERVRLFFENRTNPNPGQSIVNMKLHEERSIDPETGKPVKETYYLELNYDTFTSKQSKKVKRYS